VAGSHQIAVVVGATIVEGDDVLDFQRHAGAVAVMAGVVVALEDLEAFGLGELASEDGGSDRRVAA
jgi:hypothetical protein